ncbi:MAG TPA: heparan-alpha-glucosaminide N-acetyltransferase domain-containing protein [Thermoanaerobaculia bacterium]|nr:heparan-alpha-glucosaminide N-acetyltransferase domain-containing protein [Thermoanaerobaculia bacterium]
MHGSASPETRERLLALDVFRGVTIAAMLLVNNPGSWSSIYAPLEHAEWHGWTPTDLIFPFFLFIVGITTHLSKKEPKRIVRRGLTIVLLGLLLNAFPFFWWGKMAGVPNPTFLDRVAWRFEHLRFAGVLQRIGIAYIAAALIALYATRRQIIITILAILIGYWVLMTCVPVPGSGELGAFVLDKPDKTLAAWVDRAVLGTNHIWSSTKTWDPEGPLSTLPAIATALLGVLAGEWVTRRDKTLIERVAKLYGAGCLAMIAGKLWDWVFPINKNLWTSSYVLFTAGFACVALATCLWLIDVEGVRGWTRPFVIYGVNPMVAFVGSGLMARTIDSLVKVGGKSLHAITFGWMNAWFFSPKFASLLWGLGFVALWLGILALLHRRGLILKV